MDINSVGWWRRFCSGSRELKKARSRLHNAIYCEEMQNLMLSEAITLVKGHEIRLQCSCDAHALDDWS